MEQVGLDRHPPFYVKDRVAERYARNEELYDNFEIDLSDYYCPPTGGGAELTSWIAMAKVVEETPPPPQLRQAEVALAKYYPKSRARWSERDSPERMQEIASSLNRASNPGYPWAKHYASIGAILDDQEALNLVFYKAMWRVERLSKMDNDLLREAIDYDPAFAVKNNLADPGHRFHKMEPTPKRKIDNGKARGVTASSIVDQVVEKILFGPQDSVELKHWRTIPSKPGAGMSDDDAAAIWNYVKDNGIDCCSDVANWDECVQQWMHDADARIRIMLNNQPDEEWSNAVRYVSFLIGHRLTMLSDGRIFRRIVPGSQQSGRKITSSENSRIRALMAMILSIKLDYRFAAITMGDDAGEHLPDRITEEVYHQEMLKLGFVVKPLKRGTDIFYFCSQEYGPGFIRPENTTRMLVRFMASESTRAEAYDSLAINLRHHPKCDKILSFAKSQLPDPQDLVGKSENLRI